MILVAARDGHESCHNVCPPECNAVLYKQSTSRMAIGNEMMYELIETLPGHNKSRQQTESYVK